MLYKTNNECFSFVRWYSYFHSVKDGMFYSTRQNLCHCTHNHSLFVYYAHRERSDLRDANFTLLVCLGHYGAMGRVHHPVTECTFAAAQPAGLVFVLGMDHQSGSKVYLNVIQIKEYIHREHFMNEVYRCNSNLF